MRQRDRDLAGPVPPGERVEMLDALRGLAVLGIFVINLLAFSEWKNTGAEHQAALPTAVADQAVFFLTTLLVEGKFYSLFSLLFGIGFAVQMLRAEEKGIDVGPRFRRRLWVLFGIGMVHLCFVWAGDILVLYALLGFVLLPVRRLGDRPLLLAAGALLLSPIVIHAAVLLSGGVLDPGAPLYRLAERVDAHFGFVEDEFPWVWSRIGWVEFFQLNVAGPLWRYGDILHTSRAPKVLGMFLLGFVAARRLVFRDPAAHRTLLRRVLGWGLALGLGANVVWTAIKLGLRPEFLSWQGVAETVGYALGVAPLALAYAAGVALLWLHAGWRGRLMAVAPAGRMALSNYLFQSVVGIALFYGVGLGWTGSVGPSLVVVLAVVVFGAQVQFSAWWLRRYRFGPAEWLWRSLTYGTRQPMRVPAPVPGAALPSTEITR